ncbi:hypothetical protein HYZ41_01340 [archaeon]|nr:hypothetical protein [archaeon]
MQNFSQKDIAQMKAEVFILDWMLGNRIGKHQTTFENMIRRVPSDNKYGDKASKAALENLIRRGFISTKRKHYGVHISLLPQKIDEMLNYVKELEQKIRA